MPQYRITATDVDGERVEGIVIVSESRETAAQRMLEIGYTDIGEPEEIPEGVPVPEIQKVMDAMPGLIGGIDHALIDHIGKPIPFVLVMFSGTTAVHATNFDGAAAMGALRGFVKGLDEQARDEPVGG